MIARIWHGRVLTAKAKAYREFLNARAIPDYQAVDGNLKVYILERAEGDITHFITLTFWRDLDSIKGFAVTRDRAHAHPEQPARSRVNDAVETAKYYPEDSDFLLEYEPTVAHYEIVGTTQS